MKLYPENLNDIRPIGNKYVVRFVISHVIRFYDLWNENI